MKQLFLISDLAKHVGITVDAIRFYEKKGLLHPIGKAENGYRYYNQNSLDRLIFIKNCRELDLSIDEITQLLAEIQEPSGDCHQVNNLIDHHLDELENKIKLLETFKLQLMRMRQSCNGAKSIDNCLILKELKNK